MKPCEVKSRVAKHGTWSSFLIPYLPRRVVLLDCQTLLRKFIYKYFHLSQIPSWDKWVLTTRVISLHMQRKTNNRLENLAKSFLTRWKCDQTTKLYSSAAFGPISYGVAMIWGTFSLPTHLPTRQGGTDHLRTWLWSIFPKFKIWYTKVIYSKQPTDS